MKHRVLPCTVLSCPVLSCPVQSCPVLSCPVLSCHVLCCPVPCRPVLSCPVLPVIRCYAMSSSALSYPLRSCPVLSRAVPCSSVTSCAVCYSMLNPHTKSIHFVHTYLRNSALVLCSLRLQLLRPIHTARAPRNTIAGGSRFRAKSAIARREERTAKSSTS